jgi:hypothetical protein
MFFFNKLATVVSDELRRAALNFHSAANSRSPFHLSYHRAAYWPMNSGHS